MLRNSQLAWIILGVVSVLGVGVGALTIFANFRFRHPRFPDAKIVDRDGHLIVVSKKQETPAPGKSPKAVMENTEHDFGVLPPHTSVTHKFVIKNVGDAPLLLSKGKSTCKCTFANLPKDGIPPGGEAEVAMVWNTGRINSYEQSAEVRTNDPTNPRFFLTVKGKIDIRTALEPAALQMERLEPDKSHSAKVLAYSREWDAFQIKDLSCTIPNASVEAVPAEEEVLKSKGANSGYWITVNLPGMEPGRFNGAIRGVMTNGEEDSTDQPIDVIIGGRVLRRLSVYGKDIDGLGNVTLGVITLGDTKTARLLMKVKDEVLDIPIREIDIQPNYLDVKVERTEKSATKGLYSLTIGTTKDAPVSSHLGDQHGVVRFEFDHPRIQELKLNVRFAVVAPDRG